jgi:glycosyltransferase involved in cell wall biosynthesis
MHALFEPELPTYFQKWRLRASSSIRLRQGYGGHEAATFLVGKVGRSIDRFLPGLADGIAAVDISIVEHLKTLGLGDDNVALVLPPAIPPSATTAGTTRQKKKKMKAVYIGNLDPYQGLDNLLAGLQRLDDSLTNRLTVDIVTASEPSDLKRDVKHRCLDSLVRVVPHNTPEEAWEHLLAADFTVIPRTLRGGAPIKLINALGAGCPALVDNAFGEELQSGREVYAINMKNPYRVAEAVNRLVIDGKLRKTLAKGARKAADRLYHPQKSLKALEELYEKLL